MLFQFQQFNIVNVLPSYFDPLFKIPLIPFLLLSAIFLVLILPAAFVLLWFARLKQTIKDNRKYLEVRPIYKTLQSPLSTKQLFTIIHSIGQQTSFFRKTVRSKT